MTAPAGALRLRWSSRSWSASRFWLLLNRTRFGFDLRATGAVRDRRGRQRHQRQADGRRLDAALRRRRRPDRHADPLRRRLHLRLDVPVRARLRRHRGRAARPQQPDRDRPRRAALRLPRRAVQPAAASWSASRPTSSRSPRASSCSPWSSPTRWSAATASASSSARSPSAGPPRRHEPEEVHGMSVATASATTAARRRRAAPSRSTAAPAAALLVLARVRARSWRCRCSRSSPAPTTSPRRAPCRAALIATVPDPAGRPRRPVVRARRRGQHRPRGHDDPRHLGRRLLRLPLRPVGRRRSAPSRWACSAGSLHALATVIFGVDHIVSGVAINIIALGAAQFLAEADFADLPGGGPTPVAEDPRRARRSRSRPLADSLITLEDKHWFLVSRPRRAGPRAGHQPVARSIVIALLLAGR